MGSSARLALVGLGRTTAGSGLGDGEDVSVIPKVAADASALGSPLGLTPARKASIPKSSNRFF